jgi:hypothetical protein
MTMASMLEHHQKLTNGVGKCSVPMWAHGCPAGFCDQPAYGDRPPGREWRDAYTGEMKRFDGRYNGYVPGLACPAHGGPPPTHFGDPCIRCGIPHDDVPVGPCRGA